MITSALILTFLTYLLRSFIGYKYLTFDKENRFNLSFLEKYKMILYLYTTDLELIKHKKQFILGLLFNRLTYVMYGMLFILSILILFQDYVVVEKSQEP